MKTINVLQLGLGAMGRTMAEMVLERPGLRCVGTVDHSPDLVGKDLGEVLGRRTEERRLYPDRG